MGCCACEFLVIHLTAAHAVMKMQGSVDEVRLAGASVLESISMPTSLRCVHTCVSIWHVCMRARVLSEIRTRRGHALVLLAMALYSAMLRTAYCCRNREQILVRRAGARPFAPSPRWPGALWQFGAFLPFLPRAWPLLMLRTGIPAWSSTLVCCSPGYMSISVSCARFARDFVWISLFCLFEHCLDAASHLSSQTFTAVDKQHVLSLNEPERRYLAHVDAGQETKCDACNWQ